MNVNEFYTEVQERCKDLDEFIAKKQGFWYINICNVTIEFGYRFHGRQIFYQVKRGYSPPSLSLI